MNKWKVIASLIATMSTTIFSTVKVLPQVNSATIVSPSQQILEGRCGDNANYLYDDNKKTVFITGSGKMWNGLILEGSAEKVVIEKGITSIGEGWFCRHSLKSVDMPDTVKIINSRAFFQIIGKFTIPKSVEKVESGAIRRAKDIVIEGDMKDYGYGALGETVKSIQIGGSAKTLGYALAKVYRKNIDITLSENNVKTKEINGCLMSADGKDLYYCTTDKDKIVIPDTVEKIESAAFYKKNIKEVVLGKNVKVIGDYAFNKCSISKLRVNNKLKSVGKMAFANTKIKKITFKSNVKMGAKAFDTSVKINFKNSGIKFRTTMTKAKIGKKINITFCNLPGIKKYQVKISKGKKSRKYIIDNNKISLNEPKNLLGIYDIEYSYNIDQSMYTLSEEPAYVTVRPFKRLKNGKKVFGAWSSKMILTK